MLPRLGLHNEHCFAHAGNHKCGGESYLHKAAKLLLARRFNERSKPFVIGLTSERPCVRFDNCQEAAYKCSLLPEYKEYNLMEFYDLPAEVEIDILEPDGKTHFTPDAMLRSSSSNREDIFIEVYYKHKVTKEKKESGHQIIEIRVRELADLKSLEEMDCFKESKDIVYYNFKPRKATPEQIEAAIRQCSEENGFNNCESALPPCKQTRETKRQQSPIRRLTLFKSGKLFDEGIFENERGAHRPSALMDIVYERGPAFQEYPLLGVMAKYDGRARMCFLCEHCIKSGVDTVTWCKLVKNGSTRKGTFDPLKGSGCLFFEWPRISTLPDLMDRIISEKEKYNIWINPE